MKIIDFYLEKVTDEDIVDGTFDIPSGVSIICKNAFEFTSLEKIIIPNGVKEIDDYAFYHCTKLKSVILPKGIIRIGRYAFANSNIDKAIIPNGVEIIDNHAFYSCQNLEEILIPNSVKEIREHAFCECPKLKMAKVPYLTKLWPYTFNTYGTRVIRVPFTTKLMNKQQDIMNPNDALDSIIIEMQAHINNLKNMKIENLDTSISMSVEKFGAELNAYPMIISSAFYSAKSLDKNDKARNVKLKKILDRIDNNDKQSLLEKIGNMFLQVEDDEIVLNKDAMNQLKTFSDNELSLLHNQNQILEGLKEMIRLYTAKLNECTKQLDTVFVSETNNEFDNRDMVSLNNSVEAKRITIQKSLSDMAILYNQISNAIDTNVNYIRSLNEVTIVLLPSIISEVANNKLVVRKQESVKAMKKIANILRNTQPKEIDVEEEIQERNNVK